MTNFAVIYLFHRFFFRLADFFHHWYLDAIRYFIHWFISFLERLDRFFAIRITLRHFSEPLWKDYSIIGRVMGPLFRFARILTGGAVYAVCTLLFLAACVAWILFPFALLVAAYRGMRVV